MIYVNLEIVPGQVFSSSLVIFGNDLGCRLVEPQSILPSGRTPELELTLADLVEMVLEPALTILRPVPHIETRSSPC